MASVATLTDFDEPQYAAYQWYDGPSPADEDPTPVDSAHLMAAQESLVAGFQAGDAAVVAWVEANAENLGGGGEGSVAITSPDGSVAVSGTPTSPRLEVSATLQAAAAAGAQALGIATQKANNGSDFADEGSTRANLHVPVLTPASCVATTNLALTGLQTIDGHTLVAGDLALLTGQTTSSQNGLWTAASGSWTRPTEFGSGVQVKARSVDVIQGNVYAGARWLLKTNSLVTVDTTAQTWVSQLPVSVVSAAGAPAGDVPVSTGSGYAWQALAGAASVPVFVTDSAPSPAAGFGEYLWFEMDGNGKLLDIQSGKA